jgi:hypothetical protein
MPAQLKRVAGEDIVRQYMAATQTANTLDEGDEDAEAAAKDGEFRPPQPVSAALPPECYIWRVDLEKTGMVELVFATDSRLLPIQNVSGPAGSRVSARRF